MQDPRSGIASKPTGSSAKPAVERPGPRRRVIKNVLSPSYEAARRAQSSIGRFDNRLAER